MTKWDSLNHIQAPQRLLKQLTLHIHISLKKRITVIFCHFRDGGKEKKPPRKTQQKPLSKLVYSVSVSFSPSLRLQPAKGGIRGTIPDCDTLQRLSERFFSVNTPLHTIAWVFATACIPAASEPSKLSLKPYQVYLVYAPSTSVSRGTSHIFTLPDCKYRSPRRA